MVGGVSNDRPREKREEEEKEKKSVKDDGTERVQISEGIKKNMQHRNTQQILNESKGLMMIQTRSPQHLDDEDVDRQKNTKTKSKS